MGGTEVHAFVSENATYNWYPYGYDFTVVGDYRVKPEIK